MDKDILKEIELLVDKAYKEIDEGLNLNNFERLEYKVAEGLDKLLEVKRKINKVK